MRMLLLLAGWVALAAPPNLVELQPRGAQKGRPFTLTLIGTGLGEGASIVSSLPATFTALGNEHPATQASFLVEPTGDWAVGVYPIRVRGANGISNILLFSVGVFPEVTEEESRPGALPHQNDSIEKAQSLPTTPLTLNGRLIGAERDFYRIQGKANERRVFEIEARRVGSAIDPVIQVYDAAGKRIGRSEDDPAIGLDARLDLTFPKDGFYYVEVFDARFSSQQQDFYRLKTGAYSYASEIYPLGGRRGENVELTISNVKVNADLSKLQTRQTFVNLPDSPALPLPFAIGDLPELMEPVSGNLPLPVTVNGRLAQAGEVDRYELSVKPGEDLIFELQARELGTSKLTGLLTVYDPAGKKLASAGDGPLPVDVAAVQVSSRTLGDPFLMLQVPEGVTKITLTVEDLASRGGPHYGYRLHARRAAQELKATILNPFVNIPRGGTAMVAVDIERRGYMGPLTVTPIGLPNGVHFSGGLIPAEMPDPLVKTMNRRAVLSLTASPETQLEGTEIGFLVKGGALETKAAGLAYTIGVSGATAQGVVDRQRALVGPWLGYQMPAALTTPTPATLELSLLKSEKKETGYEYRVRWNFKSDNTMQAVPPTIGVDVPNLAAVRIIEMEVDRANPRTGTFLVTTAKSSLPGPYAVVATGRVMLAGTPIDVVAPILRLDVPEPEAQETQTNASNTTVR